VVDLALKSLLHDKLKFAITVAGVAFAVTLVLVQVGLFLGLLDNASVTIDHIDADLWVTSKNTPNVDFAHPFPEGRVDRVRTVPGVQRADNLIVWFAQLALPSGTQEAVEIYALKDFHRWNVPWKAEGAPIDDLRRGNYMMMDNAAVRRFGTFEIGDYREVNDVRVKIIGKTDGALSFTTTPLAFFDYDRMQQLLPQILQGKTTYMLVKLAPGVEPDAVMAEIRNRLPYNDVYTKAQWSSRSRAYWVKNTGLGLNIAVTVFLGCLVGVVVVAQTLYSSTMEHIKEFGTVKAIGGSNLDIYTILTKQATIAAVFGFIFGELMARSMYPLVELIHLKLIMPQMLSVVVFIGALLMCLTAAMISFKKVASIDPALVFRS